MDRFTEILKNPGTIAFPANLAYREDLEKAGGKVFQEPSGHLVFYGRDGRRFLATDPNGHPLHECEWDSAGSLRQARLHLDWDAWVGIRPGALVQETRLDLSKKPGWQRVTADDLRGMAARSLGVSLEDICFFYRDEDVAVSRDGTATIRHRKDALYVLPTGNFDSTTRFMSCMGLMHWGAIDFLPVVELFQSLLPGTGSATFELIRGLYDDQNRERPSPLVLRYRGIPTYPSEAAYRLFSTFFIPRGPAGSDPLATFMDPARSDQVEWTPLAESPRRYFEPPTRLCLTVSGTRLQKVTWSDDPAGLPYAPPPRRGLPAANRSVTVEDGTLVLHEDGEQWRMALPARIGPLQPTSLHGPMHERGWRDFFADKAPSVAPSEAFSAVLLYPDDAAEIGEPESQPFVADYIEDLHQEDAGFARLAAESRSILIENFDAAIQPFVALDHPRSITVRFRRPALAQKQAQQLWGRLAQHDRLDWLPHIRFVSTDAPPGQTSFDIIYSWVPYVEFMDQANIRARLDAICRTLSPRGAAFIAGPASIADIAMAVGLRPIRVEPVASLPPFKMHLSLLPQARLHRDLTLIVVTR